MNKEQFRVQIQHAEFESPTHPLANFLENIWVRQNIAHDHTISAKEPLRWMGNEKHSQNAAIIKGFLYAYPWKPIEFELGGKKHTLSTGDRIVTLHIDPISQTERLDNSKRREYINNLGVAFHDLANSSINHYYQYLIAGSWESLIYSLVTRVPAFSIIGVLQDELYKDRIIQNATKYSDMNAQIIRNKSFPIVATTGLDFAECVFGHKISYF